MLDFMINQDYNCTPRKRSIYFYIFGLWNLNNVQREEGCLPQELKDAWIVRLCKGKGDTFSCDNYRGISLLSIAGKILCKLILNRLNTHLLDEIVPESQCGFRKNRGTVDMIFCARQIQEKCKEQNKDLYILFVDLTKAFDTVSRPGLWRILPRIGIPPHDADNTLFPWCESWIS